MLGKPETAIGGMHRAIHCKVLCLHTILDLGGMINTLLRYQRGMETSVLLSNYHNLCGLALASSSCTTDRMWCKAYSYIHTYTRHTRMQAYIRTYKPTCIY